MLDSTLSICSIVILGLFVKDVCLSSCYPVKVTKKKRVFGDAAENGRFMKIQLTKVLGGVN